MFNIVKISVFLMACFALNTQTRGLTLYDDFTQATVNDSPGIATGNGMDWAAVATACLTAGGSSSNSTKVPITDKKFSNIPYCNPVAIGVPGGGALRFSTSSGTSNGAIISRGSIPSSEGIEVTFMTYSYAFSGGDGMGFFLQDAAVPVTLPYTGDYINTGNSNIGSYGGAMAYSCSNTADSDFNGLTGAYLGLGIDEYGQFTNPEFTTSSGPGVSHNSISLRGAGNVSWYWLSNRYPRQYPTSLRFYDQSRIVNNTCKTGLLQNGLSGNLSYSTSALSWSAGVLTVTVAGTSDVDFLVGDTINIASTGNKPPQVNGSSIVGSYVVTAVSGKTFSFSYPNGATTYANPANGTVTVQVKNYPFIEGSLRIIPAETPLWSRVPSRPTAKSRTFKLSISPQGVLNLFFSYNGGSYQSVLSNIRLTEVNGPLPANFRIGFSGTTGGTNDYELAMHEIVCFAGQTNTSVSNSSAGANVIQSGQVRTGTQVYLAAYDPYYWFGRLVSDAVINTNGVLSVSTASQWDANCGLTGGACASMGTSNGVAINTLTAQPPNSRNILTWNGSGGIPFRWDNLTPAQQAVLNSTDQAGADRVDWLRGVRTLEETNGGAFRARLGVLGDIVGSSPVLVGAPSKNYPTSFTDALTGAQGSETDYASFKNSLATRLNVVYSGSNDGMLHGFRAGSNNSDGTYNASKNDGYEVLGYVPGTVLSNSNVVGLSNPVFSHQYFVDATPGFGDLYYGGAWHTWLVGGLGSGGAGIYALDVTDPTGMVKPGVAFSEKNAASLVIGDWTPASLTAATCVNAPTNCGYNLGKVTGTPLIRRLHNGQWAIIFGNGIDSDNRRAGVFIGLISPRDGSVSFYWLDTGIPTNPAFNGISYVSSADLDGDFIVDYLYAGDLQGNLWRFDLTSSNPANWTLGPTLIHVAQDNSGNLQPITTSIAVTATLTGGAQRVILGFGTGRATPFTKTSPTTFATGTQSVYGIWDWALSAWNAKSSTQYATQSIETPMYYQLFSRSSLLNNTLSTQGTSERKTSASTVCWYGSKACTSGNTHYGWVFDLPDNGEQVIYNPVFTGGLLLLNTTIPTTSTCTINLPSGWTMGFDMASGGGLPQNVFADSKGSFIATTGASLTGLKQGAVGTPYMVTIGSKPYAISSNVTGGAPLINELNAQGGVTIKRISWEQLR